MFMSKPWPIHPGGTKPSETYCDGPWAQQPWMMPLVLYKQVASSSGSSSAEDSSSSDSSEQDSSGDDSSGDDSSGSNSREADPWLEPKLIRLQYHEGYRNAVHAAKSYSQHMRSRHKHHHLLHKEKNWNAFIYNNEVYFSQVSRIRAICLVSHV